MSEALICSDGPVRGVTVCSPGVSLMWRRPKYYLNAIPQTDGLWQSSIEFYMVRDKSSLIRKIKVVCYRTVHGIFIPNGRIMLQ